MWSAEAPDSRSAALKVLHRTSPRDYERFQREVEICQGLDPEEYAILPVLDSHLPASPSGSDLARFAMPLASPLMPALSGASLDEKVSAVREATRTLAGLLADHGLHHRDVKPENLYRWEGRTVVGDFGLATRPEDPALTTHGPVGPFHHMPSEVLVGDEDPDWERADVYCLANTLWRLAVEKLYPPRGQIRATEDDSLGTLLPSEPYAGRLAGLIESATSRSPASRPTLHQFADQLDDWLSTRQSTEDFALEFESAETRKIMILRWLVREVRTQPTFWIAMWEVPRDADRLSQPSDVPGLTEQEVAEALIELIEDGAVEGDIERTMGLRLPYMFSKLYPSLEGVGRVEEVESLTAQAAPLLRALVEEHVELTFPRKSEPVSIHDGLTLLPAEAYFQLRLLEQRGFVSYVPLYVTPGYVSLGRVRATSSGKRWLTEP